MSYFFILSLYIIFGSLILQEIGTTAILCKENEVYYDCAPCEETCENIFIKTPCDEECTPGCRCDIGLVRNNTNGNCINKWSCPTDSTLYNCPKNAEFNGCMNALTDPSCKKELYYPRPQVWLPACQSSCRCKKGYVNDDITNKGCILENECPTVMDCTEIENTVYNSCGIPNRCNPFPEDNEATEEIACRPGCFCRDGFIENIFHEYCIPKDECLTCDAAIEIFPECTARCLSTCVNHNSKYCNYPYCPFNCACKRGFVLDPESNKCVDRTSCEKHCKDYNADYSTCGSSCIKTCDNLQESNIACTDDCITGCFCKEGYVLNRKENKCILEELC